MTFSIKKGEKFACIAFSNICKDNSLNSPVELSRGDWVLPSFPKSLSDQYFHKEIGELKAEDLQKSNLLIIKKQHSSKPDVLDEENKYLVKNIDLLWYSILLFGVPRYNTAFHFTGAYDKYSLKIREFSGLIDYYNSYGDEGAKVTLGKVKKAWRIRNGVSECLYERDGEGFYKNRISRGFTALILGIQKSHTEDRIHQFVRSLEAVVKPSIGKTKREFIDRCQTFITDNFNSRLVIEEIYDIRSKVEHIHDWQSALLKYNQQERGNIGYLRVRQAEALALFVYKKLAGLTKIRKFFEDDSAIDSFWSQPKKDRLAIWKEKINLERVK